MADTYTQLYIHIVFAVKGRQSLIPKQHKTELHKYITGIITGKKPKSHTNQFYAGPYSHSDWYDAGDCALGFGPRH